MKSSTTHRIGFAYALLITIVIAGLLGGCATQNGWTPRLDRTLSPRPPGQDIQDCRAMAANQGMGAAAVDGALAGGLFGAALGAALGAVIGDPGFGAALGAASGGFSGGAQNAMATEAEYREIMRNCLRGRGHNPLN